MFSWLVPSGCLVVLGRVRHLVETPETRGFVMLPPLSSCLLLLDPSGCGPSSVLVPGVISSSRRWEYELPCYHRIPFTRWFCDQQ